jgi:predicted nucleic acid-binding protein
VTDEAVYLDASAIIKLIFAESETGALAQFLAERRTRTSSAVARLEVLRAAARVHDPVVVDHANDVLAGIDLIRFDDRMLAAAITVRPPTLGSLDAIHLATALSLGPDLSGMVVYGKPLARAARRAGLTVWAPA